MTLSSLCSRPMPAERRTGRHTIVVGGGLLGMRLAQRLVAEGQRVTLLEAASHAGGLADHQDLAGHRWDRFYHVILKSDLATLRLLRELGLESQVRWGVTRTGFFADGQLHSLSNSIEFLRFPALSLLDKFRLGLTIFAASRIRDWRPLESTLAVDWLRRWSGKRVPRAHLAAAAEEQAWRKLSHCKRSVHLGNHRAHVCGPPQWPEARGVWLPCRWLRSDDRGDGCKP